MARSEEAVARFTAERDQAHADFAAGFAAERGLDPDEDWTPEAENEYALLAQALIAEWADKAAAFGR